MTATVVDYMEQRSYQIAKQLCSTKISDRVSQRVGMPELFNMIAGSETGAILASTLSLSNLGSTDNTTAM